MIRKKSMKKSPLEDKPLRNPGQWLDEEINRIYEDQISIYAVYIAFIIGFVLLAWVEFLFPSKNNPTLATLIGFGALSYFVFRLVKAKRSLDKVKLGRDGEKAVGHGLEELRVSWLWNSP